MADRIGTDGVITNDEIRVNGYVGYVGCYVDGHHGQYAPDQMAGVAERFGWERAGSLDDPRVWRERATFHEDRGDAESAEIGWGAFHESTDDLTDWLNEHTTGAVWVWDSGELFLTDDVQEYDHG
jgi:hypothetical protein